MSSCSDTMPGSCPLLVNAVLSFIKAFRLKGDHNSIKRIVEERDAIEQAKKLLWDSCKTCLESNGLTYYHNRISLRDSDRRSQIDANLEDILQALEVP